MIAAKSKTPTVSASFEPISTYYGSHESNKKSPALDWCSKYNNLWKRSDWLFSFLRTEADFYRQPIKLRLPLLFYLGHLPCFAWVQFRHLPGVNHTIDRVFDELFRRGVDPDVQTGEIHHSHSSRHSIDENVEFEYWRAFSVQSIVEYKLKVRAEILSILTSGQIDYQDCKTLDVLHVTAEHEMMHQETLMYLFSQLPIDALQINLINQMNIPIGPIDLPLPENSWVFIPAGPASLGKPYHDSIANYSFGWDNEYPSDAIYVSSFELQSHPVRVGDFLEFVIDGGYGKEEYWESSIFSWLNESKISCPASWTYNGKSYYVNFIFRRDVPIEYVLTHPVIVSQDEANAYCRWLSNKTDANIELPTEAEWVYSMWDASICMSSALTDATCNINFRHLHTLPIQSSSENKLQWQGSAFEWTSSLFRPFVGYQGDLPSYPGYSSDFFDDKHFVLLGGSFATDLTLIRRTFRNWYQHDYRFVFATFRCVRRSGHTDHPLTDIDRQDIIKTLSNSQHRSISSQYFYDAHGSAIYEQITQLDEYYLYNQELKLLQQRAIDIKKTILGNSRLSSTINFIELGCGDGSKVEKWLLPWIKSSNEVSFNYHPVDISQHAIDSLIQRLKQTLGETVVERCVKPICASFDEIHPELDMKSDGVKVIMLLGSTIGNFSSFDDQQVKYGDQSPVMKFIRSIRSNLKSGDWFLCGFDLCKNIKTMVEAYSDSKGVTAAFNYNLLRRLNRELNFNFKIKNYQHYALFNPLLRRMESWLISTKQQTVTDQNGFTITLEPYEAIQTEVSTKYTEEDIALLMSKTGFQIIECYQVDHHHLPYAFCMAQAI